MVHRVSEDHTDGPITGMRVGGEGDGVKWHRHVSWGPPSGTEGQVGVVIVSLAGTSEGVYYAMLS